MITKLDAGGYVVDWDKVNKATEVARTYLITDNEGREFYKMYKPSEAQQIFKDRHWTGKIVSILRR